MQEAFTRQRLGGLRRAASTRRSSAGSTRGSRPARSPRTRRSSSSPSTSPPTSSWVAPRTTGPPRWTGSTAPSSTACRRPARSCAATCRSTRWRPRPPRPRGARGLPAPLPAVAPGRAHRRPVLPAVPRRVRRRRALQRRRRRRPHGLPDDGRPRHLDEHPDHDGAPPRPAPGVAGAVPCRSPLALPERPTFAELDALATLPLVMKEALRLTAPVPVVVRQTVKDTEVEGVRIPRGTFCIVTVQHSHLMPELWSTRCASTPSASPPSGARTRSHRDAWQPFGGGVHKCLGMVFAGMEVAAVMHHLLRALRVARRPRLPAAHEQPLAPVPQGRPAGRPAAPVAVPSG